MSAATVSVLLRMPEELKKNIAAAAEEAGVSVNQWLLSAAEDRLDTGRPAGMPSHDAILAGSDLIINTAKRLAAGWTLNPPITEQNGHRE